jgi:hypothetical protein
MSEVQPNQDNPLMTDFTIATKVNPIAPEAFTPQRIDVVAIIDMSQSDNSINTALKNAVIARVTAEFPGAALSVTDIKINKYS